MPAESISRLEFAKRLNDALGGERFYDKAMFLTMGDLAIEVPGGHVFISSAEGELRCQFSVAFRDFRPDTED